MSYVTDIVCRFSGAPVVDGEPANAEPGDYPQVHYDLARLASEVDRDTIANGPASLWRYAPLLPARDPADAVTLGEGWTPMLGVPRLAQQLDINTLFAKDEGRNPSGTFKDRGASVATTRLRELGISTVIHNSSGNAAGAWAMYSARAGIRVVNLMPMDALSASRKQSTLAGARTVLLDGPWQHSGAMVGDAVSRHGWFNVGTLKEPHRLEGKKTMGLEIAEQLGWTLPDAIVYPTGGALGAVAIYKGLRELQALGWVPAGPLPKLIVTQYAGCAPIVRAFDSGQAASEVWTDLDVPPGGLKSTRPPGDRAVLELLRETGGTAVAVSTEDAITAATEVVRLEGLFPCPEVGTTVAGLRQAREAGVVNGDDRVVMMFTGSGLKSIPVLPDGTMETIQAGEVLSG
jgi:threonine synthase